MTVLSDIYPYEVLGEYVEIILHLIWKVHCVQELACSSTGAQYQQQYDGTGHMGQFTSLLHVLLVIG